MKAKNFGANLAKIFSANLFCVAFALLFAPNLVVADAENSDFHTIDLGHNKNI